MSKRKKAVIIVGCVGLAILFLAVSFYIGMSIWEHNQRNKVTYRNGEERHSYKSLARLMEEEELEFLFPARIPETVRVEEVWESEADNSFHIQFSPISSGYSMTVRKEAESRQPEEGAENILCSGIMFELKVIEKKERPSVYWAGGWYNGYFYILQAPNREGLLMMLNSLK